MIWLVLLALTIPTALVLLVLAAARPARPKPAAVQRRRRIIFFVGAGIVGVAQMAIGIVKLWQPVISPQWPPWLYYSSAVWSVLYPVLLGVLFWRTNRQQTVPSR